MSISKLTNYTHFTNNCGNVVNGKLVPARNHKIDTITIHSVVGQASVEGLGVTFSGSREVSANYGIGADGRIGAYVDENNRSWCSSSPENDNRAITIEVATDTTEPYAVNAAAYDSLITLLVDICQRHNIPKLIWKNDKSLIGQVDKQNMTVHKWFAATTCPNTYILSKLPEICDKVNARLQSAAQPVESEKKTFYRVQVGSFSKRENAEALSAELAAKGYTTVIMKVEI